MKAIRVHEAGGPEVLRWEEAPDPEPGPDQIRVRIGAAGVNPVDTYIRAGMGNYKPAAYPYIPGLDGAGTVDAVGSEVKRFQPGDRVYVTLASTGTYAELALASQARVFSLPGRVSLAQGAGVATPYGTAYRALFQRAQGRPGESVLVHGASGGVGTAAVQIARAAGFVVYGTGGSEAGRKLVLDQGAHHVLDHRSEGYLDQLRDLTGGRGVDIVLEMLANVNLAKDLKILAPRGRVVVIGSRGPIEIDPRDTMGRDTSILGMALFNATEAELTSAHAYLVAGLANGSLNPIVGKELPMSEAPRAHEAVMEAGAYGKIVLRP